jgi:hypothetical protein
MWPRHLPDGRLLVTAWANSVASASLLVVDPATGARQTIATGAAGAHWLPGHLVYARSGGVVTSTFDLERLTVGPPRPAPGLEQVLAEPFTGLLQLAVAGDVMVHLPGSPGVDPADLGERRLHRLLPPGDSTPLPLPARLYRNLEMAPDGRRAAVTIVDGEGSDVWIADITNGDMRRLTFDGFDIEPIWSPDGLHVTFASNRGGHYGIYDKRADGAGRAELLFDIAPHSYPWGWLPDGKQLLYVRTQIDAGWDLWLWDRRAGDGGSHRPLFPTSGQEGGASPSPDGRLLAVETTVTGQWEIFLYDFLDLTSRWQVSDGGGWNPFWSADAETLYYLDTEGLMAVPIARQPTVQAGTVVPGTPRRAFSADDLLVAQYAAGGIVAIREQEIHDPEALRVTLGWPSLLADS